MKVDHAVRVLVTGGTGLLGRQLGRALPTRGSHVRALVRRENRDTLRRAPPLIRVVASGTYIAYRQRRVADGAPKAQVRVPHLTPHMDFGSNFHVVEEYG